MGNVLKDLKGNVTVISINYNIGLRKEILALKTIFSAQFIGDAKYQISYKFKDSFKNSYFLFYNSSIYNIPLSILLILLRKKILYCFHEPYYTKEELELWGNKKIKYIGVNYVHAIMYRLTHNPIVFSNFAKLKLYAGFGRSKETIKLPLPNLISSKPNIIVSEQTPNKKDILFVGAITSFKNPYRFIENSEMFFKRNFNYQLKIFSRSNFDPLYNRLHISAEIKQNISDEDIYDYISKSWIVLLCHDFCTQSGVLPTALALGKPVLIMKSKNYKYEPLIDKYCGRIINFTEEDISESLIDIENNYNAYSINANNYYNKYLNILSYNE